MVLPHCCQIGLIASLLIAASITRRWWSVPANVPLSHRLNEFLLRHVRLHDVDDGPALAGGEIGVRIHGQGGQHIEEFLEVLGLAVRMPHKGDNSLRRR